MYRVILVCASLLLSSCYDSAFDKPAPSTDLYPATTTIAELNRQYVGSTFMITTDVVVEGRVTSSDRAENFYRTLCVEQEQSALEVMAGIDQLCNDFPIGSRVTLHIKGLALGQSRGMLQIGRQPTTGSGHVTDYLGSRAAVAAVVKRADESIIPIAATSRTIPSLSPTHCGTLVRIDHLRYSPEGLDEGNWGGYKRFTDVAGNSIYTYVRTYASFATQEVPTEFVSLCGILQYDSSGEGRYLIKLRDATDCSL